jgi:hypothetical protein
MGSTRIQSFYFKELHKENSHWTQILYIPPAWDTFMATRIESFAMQLTEFFSYSCVDVIK